MSTAKFIDRSYLGLLLILCIFVCLAWFKLSSEPSFFDRHWISFGKFYSAGRIIASKDRQRLYDPCFQRARLTEFVKPSVLPPIRIVDGYPTFPDGFAEHPPHFFMLYVPASLLKPIWALRLYTAVCWLLGVAGLIWLTRTAKTLNVAQTLALAVGATASFPGRFVLALGQPTWLVMGLYAAFMVLWLRKTERLAGVVLALLTIKPQYPIFFAIPALVTRKWQLLLWGLFAGCLLLFACILTVGFQNVVSYVPMISRMNSVAGFATSDAGMPSVRGLTCSFFGAAAGIKTGYVCAILAVLFTSWIWWRTDKGGRDPRWAFAITLISVTVFSPHIFRYDLLFLVLAAALTLDSLSLSFMRSRQNWNSPGKWTAGKSFVVWRYMLITYPVTSMLVQYGGGDVKVMALIEFCSNLLLLLLAVHLWSSSVQDKTVDEPVRSH